MSRIATARDRAACSGRAFARVGDCRSRSTLGFSLVEVLVALVVLSIGMLGIADLFTQGLGAERTALRRSQAIGLTADMAERIRGNRLGHADYGAGFAADNGCDRGRACTPIEVAQHDLHVFLRQVAATLPVGRASVRLDGATAPPSLAIRVEWHEVGVGPVSQQLSIHVAAP